MDNLLFPHSPPPLPLAEPDSSSLEALKSHQFDGTLIDNAIHQQQVQPLSRITDDFRKLGGFAGKPPKSILKTRAGAHALKVNQSHFSRGNENVPPRQMLHAQERNAKSTVFQPVGFGSSVPRQVATADHTGYVPRKPLTATNARSNTQTSNNEDRGASHDDEERPGVASRNIEIDSLLSEFKSQRAMIEELQRQLRQLTDKNCILTEKEEEISEENPEEIHLTGGFASVGTQTNSDDSVNRVDACVGSFSPIKIDPIGKRNVGLQIVFPCPRCIRRAEKTNNASYYLDTPVPNNHICNGASDAVNSQHPDPYIGVEHECNETGVKELIRGNEEPDGMRKDGMISTASLTSVSVNKLAMKYLSPDQMADYVTRQINRRRTPRRGHAEPDPPVVVRNAGQRLQPRQDQPKKPRPVLAQTEPSNGDQQKMGRKWVRYEAVSSYQSRPFNVEETEIQPSHQFNDENIVSVYSELSVVDYQRNNTHAPPPMKPSYYQSERENVNNVQQGFHNRGTRAKPRINHYPTRQIPNRMADDNKTRSRSRWVTRVPLGRKIYMDDNEYNNGQQNYEDNTPPVAPGHSEQRTNRRSLQYASRQFHSELGVEQPLRRRTCNVRQIPEQDARRQSQQAYIDRRMPEYEVHDRPVVRDLPHLRSGRGRFAEDGANNFGYNRHPSAGEGESSSPDEHVLDGNDVEFFSDEELENANGSSASDLYQDRYSPRSRNRGEEYNMFTDDSYDEIPEHFVPPSSPPQEFDKFQDIGNENSFHFSDDEA